jgi:vancomycin resistance protein YoaR
MSSRTRRWLLVVAGVLGGLLVLVVGGWAVDAAIHSGQVARNVELDGQAVGGLSETDLRAAVAARDQAYASTGVQVTTPAGSFDLTAAEAGLTIDEEATVDAALDAGRDGSILTRPFTWMASLVGHHHVAVVHTVDDATVATALAPAEAANRVEPVEPTIELVDDTIRAVPGIPGTTLDLGTAGPALVAAAAGSADPVVVDLPTVPLPPDATDAEAEAIAAEANELSASPLTIVVADTTTTVEPATLRAWMRAVPGDDGQSLALELDVERVEADLAAEIGAVGTPPVELTWDVGPAGVTWTEGSEGTRCCAPDSVQKVVDTLATGGDRVELTLTTATPEHDAAWAESMRIVEPVATFTTPHACCEPRVDNIQRMADLVRGAVIEPGETFSLNGYVGPRTTAKGFVPAGVIYQGRFTTDVGGGVSQFTTTLFNAAFFAGLDIPAYQAHTIYISRYPYGREATLSYPEPDLKLRNNTPYGILIWPTYDGTSITVTLYSTRYIDADQTGQRTQPAGACTRVFTDRTRTWIGDGRSEVDTFGAIYQPAEGVLC